MLYTAHGEGVRRGRDQERGVAADSRAPRRRRAETADESEDHAVVPRSRHRVSESVEGGQSRAAPDQHRRFARRSTRRPGPRSRTCFWPPTTCGRGPIWLAWKPPTRRGAGQPTRCWIGRNLERPRAATWALTEPSVFRRFKEWDRLLFEQGERHSWRHAAWAAFKQSLPFSVRRRPRETAPAGTPSPSSTAVHCRALAIVPTAVFAGKARREDDTMNTKHTSLPAFGRQSHARSAVTPTWAANISWFSQCFFVSFVPWAEGPRTTS